MDSIPWVSKRSMACSKCIRASALKAHNLLGRHQMGNQDSSHTEEVAGQRASVDKSGGESAVLAISAINCEQNATGRARALTA